MSGGRQHEPDSAIRAHSPARRVRHSAVLVLPAGLLLATYVVGLTWPMRIWHRPVSPHTHLVGTLGISWSGVLTYVALVLLVFVLYGFALWLVLTRRAAPSPLFILGAAAAFCGALWATHPLTSTDIFNYIASARVFWIYGDNPLTTPPLAYPQDRYFALLSSWQHVPSPYGPLWSLVAGAPALVGGAEPARAVLAFKALSIGSFLAAAWLIYLTAGRLRPDSAAPAFLAFAWNPLAVFHVAGNGHNDALMVLFVAAMLYCLARGWVAAALVALAASVLVKYASALLVPLLVVWWLRSRQRPPWRSVALGCAGALALFIAAYAPMWAGQETFATTLNEGTYFTVSVPAAVRGALIPELGETRATEVTALLARGAFVAALVLILLRLRGGRLRQLVEAGFLTYFAYLTLAATYFAPWYVLWPLVFAVLLPYRRDVLWPALTLTLTAMTVLVAAVWFRERFAPDPSGDWYGMHLAAALAVFPLPVLVWLWTVRYPAGTPVRRAALARGSGLRTAADRGGAAARRD